MVAKEVAQKAKSRPVIWVFLTVCASHVMIERQTRGSDGSCAGLPFIQGWNACFATSSAGTNMGQSRAHHAVG